MPTDQTKRNARRPVTFTEWFKTLDEVGVKGRFFDPPGTRFLCPRSGPPRRPYAGEDGFFFQCYQDGMTPQQALGESLVEQDYA